MRLALLIGIALTVLVPIACAPVMRAPAKPTFALVVLEVQGADLYASTADYGLSLDDCRAAAAALPMATCETDYPERAA